MPLIAIPVARLVQTAGVHLERGELIQHLQDLGCDVVRYEVLRRYCCGRCDNIDEITATENPPVLCERCGCDFRKEASHLRLLGEAETLRVDLVAARPDMFDAGGLGRVLRNYLRPGESASYVLAPARYRVQVEAALGEQESYRPHIACCVIRGVSFDEDLIKSLMKLQENLHWALGRNRRRASIGVYDLNAIAGETLSYRAVGKRELRFVPLGFDPDDPRCVITPEEILRHHPKGRAFAFLVERFSRYPLLQDERGDVLSMPPIINSERARVRRDSSDILIDVTGTDQRSVDKALNIVATSVAELDPEAILERVEIHHAEQCRTTPDFSPESFSLDVEEAEKMIGVPLGKEKIVECLRQMGYEIPGSPDKRERTALIEVGVPAYRSDVIHSVDLVEDVAIAHGYRNIVAAPLSVMTIGNESRGEALANIVRRAMIGLGFYEVLTLILSAPRQQFERMLLPVADDVVKIKNPISMDQTMVRVSLVPGLLETFRANHDQPMPQRIFEAGKVSVLDPSAETGASERWKIAAAAIGPRVDYGVIRGVAAALLAELGWSEQAEPVRHPSFIEGRVADVIARRGDELHRAGFMGEIHPEILDDFSLVQPAVAFEIDLDLLDLLKI